MRAARVRRYDAYFADLNETRRNVTTPVELPPRTSELHAAKRAAGGAPYWYWACDCGAGSVHDDENSGRAARDAHAKVHP